MRKFLAVLLVSCFAFLPINAQVVIDPFTTFHEITLNLAIDDNANDGYDTAGVWAGGFQTSLIGRVDGFGGIFDSGFRFTGVNIPANSTIVSASFAIEVKAVSGGGGAAIIQGQDVNNAAAWNGVGPATMAVTTANVTRTLNTVQVEVFDVKAIIQEIVDGNSGIGAAVAIGVLDNGTANGISTTIFNLEDPGATEATLDIVYIP